MGTFQKILTTSLWALTVVMMVFIVSASKRIKENARLSADAPAAAGQWVAVPTLHTDAPAGQEDAAPAAPPILFDAPAFSLIDQNAKPFTNGDLKGNPWIGEFIFTTCTSICPVMMAKMAGLQQSLNARVRLISFSVDPDNDRPAVLKQKAGELHADADRWRFLTNPDGNHDGIDVVLRGMMLAVSGQKFTPSMHDNRFFLMDGAGHCRGIYSSSDAEQMDKLKEDVKTVLAERP